MKYLKVLMLVLITHLVVNNNLFALATPDEGQVADDIEFQALKDLFLALNGSSWNNKTNWPTSWPTTATNQEFGTWYGVTVSNGDISSIMLFQNGLSGTIPSSIGNLARLNFLWLYENSITGSIPVSIGNLTLLQSLRLNNNQLSGAIPSSIGNLTQLQQLYLQSNGLTGGIPSTIGNLQQLLHLYLSYNQLTSLPSEIGGLINLQQLQANANALAGTIPNQITNLSGLQHLDLSENELSGSIPSSIGSLSQLSIVRLGGNNLSGAIPTSIGSLTSLLVLNLGNNSLSGPVPSSIGNLTQLSDLQLHTNQLTSLPTEIINCTNLQSLVVTSNLLTFSSIVPIKSARPSIAFVYGSQGRIDEVKTVKAVRDSSLTLSASIDRNTSPASVYQWFLGSSNLNNASTDGHTVTIPSVSQAWDGLLLYYTISNPAAGGLTLYSENQTLNVVTCDVPPALDFQFEEANETHSFTPSLIVGEGCTASYSWNFGDGTTSTDQNVYHTFINPGAFTVTLTVNYQCGPCSSTLTKEYTVEVVNGGFCSAIYCDGVGGVGINTRKPQGFALSVNGKIRASDIIKVYPQQQWADFVFDKNYKLRPLGEVEKFIKRNGHLPEIPSAKVVETEGIELGSMDTKLLQKIEELTLYMIEMAKRSEALENGMKELKQENNTLKKELNKLKANN